MFGSSSRTMYCGARGVYSLVNAPKQGVTTLSNTTDTSPASVEGARETHGHTSCTSRRLFEFVDRSLEEPLSSA